MKKKRIDLHHHVGPDFYLKTLRKYGINEITPGEPLPNWHVEYMLDFMERFDVEAIVASLVAPGVNFPQLPREREIAVSLSREVNEGFAKMKQQHNGRFEALAVLPSNTEDALREMEYCLDTLKLGGVALFTNYDGNYLGEDRFDELFCELNKRRAVAVLHPEVSCAGIVPATIGFPITLLEFAFEVTRAAYSLVLSPNQTLIKYPYVRVVLPHLGGTLPYSLGRVWASIRIKAGDYSKVNITGIENLVKRFWFDTAVASSPWVYPSLLSVVDTDKIVFGSDSGIDLVKSPLGVERGINEFESYFKGSQEDLDRINYKNALDLFPQFSLLFN